MSVIRMSSLIAGLFTSGTESVDMFFIDEVLKEFFNSRLESRYIKNVIQKMYDEMKTYLIENNRYDEKTFKISYQYNYYGAIGVIQEWLNDGCAESPKEFGDILYSIVEKQYQ